MLKISTLSGFEGVGKSTIINEFQKDYGFSVIPETARLIIPLETSVLRDSNDDLSFKSFISYLTNMHFMLSNNMSLNVISDRNLIDSLTYLELYSKTQRIDIDMTGDFIERFNAEYSRETLYDHVILLHHTTDSDFIQNRILNDSERKYGKTVEQYITDAILWEETYLSIAYQLMNRGLAKSLTVIDSYPDNSDVSNTVLSIIQ